MTIPGPLHKCKLQIQKGYKISTRHKNIKETKFLVVAWLVSEVQGELSLIDRFRR